MTVPEVIAEYCKDGSKRKWEAKNFLLTFTDYGDYFIKYRNANDILFSLDEEVALSEKCWKLIY